MAINMRLFDLHCDTIGECWKQKKDLFENNLHLSLQRGSAYAPWRQVFAVFIPDSCRGEAAWNYFQGIYDDFCTSLKRIKTRFLFAAPLTSWPVRSGRGSAPQFSVWKAAQCWAAGLTAFKSCMLWVSG